MILSPGALRPRRPIEAAKIRFVHRPTAQVTAHNRDDPRVTGDSGTSKGALIARCCNDDHSASDGLIECLLQRLLSLGGRVCKGKTQVDQLCASLNALDDCCGKLRGVALGMCSRPEVVSVKMGRMRSVQLGQIAGAGEVPFSRTRSRL